MNNGKGAEYINLDNLKSTQTIQYEKKIRKNNIYTSICIFIVFPITIMSIVIGLLFYIEDAFHLNDIKEALLSDRSTGIVQSDSDVEKITDERFIFGYEDEIPLALSEYYSQMKESDADIYSYDESKIPEGEIGIVPMNLSRPVADGVMYVSNSSKYDFDYKEYEKMPLAVKYKKSNDYQILIIHTHGTESYTPEGAISYNPDISYSRSNDITENVVSVGSEMTKIFEENGIKTLHCEIMIDKESYSNAYSNAEEIIKDYLKKYPSIKYVFDVHRDGLELNDGRKVKTVTKIDGKSAAQVMSVVGTDTLGTDYDSWKTNLAAAVKLQLYLESKYENFVRPINIKKGSFNQELAKMSILFEVGCDGNTLNEALYSANLLALAVVDIIKSE